LAAKFLAAAFYKINFGRISGFPFFASVFPNRFLKLPKNIFYVNSQTNFLFHNHFNQYSFAIKPPKKLFRNY